MATYRIKALIFLSLLSFSLCVQAQSRLSIGLLISPSASTYTMSNTDFNYQYRFPLNYAARLSYEYGQFIFSSGLLNMSQGCKYEVEETSSENPEGTGNTFTTQIETQALALPLNVDYKFAASEKTAFTAGVGIYLGHVYSYTEESNDPLYALIEYATPYEDFYLGFNAGAGVNHRFSQKLKFEIKPNVLYQLNQINTNQETALRQLSFGLDFGLYYFF